MLVARGMQALKGGTTPLAKRGLMPAVFAGWGVLHLLTERAAGWDTAMMWIVGAALGACIGAALAKKSGMTVDRARRTVTLPGSAIPLVLILVTFAMKFWIGFELATATNIGPDSMYIVLNGLVSGTVAGIFAGRFLIYWLALRPSATPALSGCE
ncbi:putative uncharacterized protein [Caballeronia insecticola]|uniref:Transmembrane protein n=1 Tax=Caballeronia insecticola TaxID=758793 RepID=R4X034_9BURK|nr:putative uncharacterized protein [Caballeronia insecticola]